MTISDITAILTGEHMMAKNTSDRAQPLPDQIARLAYELYEARGRGAGRDVDDWLSAEQQLTHGGSTGEQLNRNMATGRDIL